MSAGVAPGRLYLVDTSAFARIDQLPVRDVVAALVADQAAATCVTVDLEACYSGRNEDDVRSIARRRRSQYRALPINEAIAQRARDVQVRMSGRGHHRAAGVVDLLTAAIAEYHGAIVLHYDAGFEHIAATTGQPHVWVVPRGTLS
ncbi:MAG: PIN domain-containing protein [Solirubrobacteraceae bacterium]